MEASPVKAGKIEKIIENNDHANEQPSSQIYLAIRPLVDCMLDHSHFGLTELFTHIGGKFYLDRLSTVVNIVKPEQVMGHFFSFSYPPSDGDTDGYLATFSVSGKHCIISGPGLTHLAV